MVILVTGALYQIIVIIGRSETSAMLPGTSLIEQMRPSD